MKEIGFMKLLAAFTLLGAVLVVCSLSAYRFYRSGIRNTPEYMHFHYGLTRQEYQKMLDLYGVTLDEVMAVDEGVFPLNILRLQIKQMTTPATRQDVEELIKGYKLKCEFDQGGWDMYFFYSTDVVEPTAGKFPLIVSVGYESSQIDNPRLVKISYENFLDSGSLDPHEIAETCGLLSLAPVKKQYSGGT